MPLFRKNDIAAQWPAAAPRLVLLAMGDVLLLGCIFACTLRHERASFADELARLGPNLAPHVLAGLGLTAIIFTGAIDLSIGGIVAVAGTVFGILHERGASPSVCFGACAATALALSSLNGWLIRLLRIPAVIVTLAGLTFYRGVALVLADVCLPGFSGQISVQDAAYHTPGKDYAGWILLAAISIALIWEVCGKRPRTWLALGSSPAACRLKGLRPDAILQSAFIAGGAFLGLAALTYSTNRLTIEPTRMALGFELQVIGAVVLGGTNIFGGQGTFAGTVLGGAFLYLIGQFMLYVGVSEYWQTGLQGAMILLVIGADCALHRREKLLEELR